MNSIVGVIAVCGALSIIIFVVSVLKTNFGHHYGNLSILNVKDPQIANILMLTTLGTRIDSFYFNRAVLVRGKDVTLYCEGRVRSTELAHIITLIESFTSKVPNTKLISWSPAIDWLPKNNETISGRWSDSGGLIEFLLVNSQPDFSTIYIKNSGRCGGKFPSEFWDVVNAKD
jgi:hypothetical protein